jgi:hypothetical protein
LRGVDLNHRPLGYEPNELPDCSTPQKHDSSAAGTGSIHCSRRSGQIVRITAMLPVIEGLAAFAEVTAGAGPVTTATIDIHPGQPYPGLTAQLPPVRASRPEPGRFHCEFAFRRSIRVSPIILNESNPSKRNHRWIPGDLKLDHESNCKHGRTSPALSTLALSSRNGSRLVGRRTSDSRISFVR